MTVKIKVSLAAILEKVYKCFMAALNDSASSLRVRKLEPWVIATHTRIARNQGQSLEQYLRDVLTERALKAQEDFADEVEADLAATAKEFGTDFPRSEDIIRAVREESC